MKYKPLLKDCPYCTAAKRIKRFLKGVCTAEKRNFLCTRNKGHKGPHVACGVADDHKLYVWEEEG
jgi:hypothetical protein